MISEEASYMWSDSEDLAIIADMYQIKIKVITSKGAGDKNPTENWILPAAELRQFAELKDVDLKDLILFHEDECHFDLIINKNHDLATMGSLSYRFNVGPILESNENETFEKEHVDTPKEVEDLKSQNNEHKMCKDELKKCQELNKRLEGDYYKCENELRNKTEECEKLKTELNLIKQTIELEKKEHSLDNEEIKMFKCTLCTFTSKSKSKRRESADKRSN